MKYKTEEWKDRIIKAANNSKTMRLAAFSLGLHYNTFIRLAKELGVYRPNQAGKGINKKDNGSKIPLEDILEGKHPNYQSNKLRQRLIQSNTKEHRCDICGLSTWLSKMIPLELHHIDGNPSNNKLENLQLLCPNCHTLTDNYRGKNIKKK